MSKLITGKAAARRRLTEKCT